jgi:hypothetical protein
MKAIISISLCVSICSIAIAGEFHVSSHGSDANEASRESAKSLTYKKVGDTELEMKIYENANHAFNFSPAGSKATHQDMEDFLVSLGCLKTKDLPIEKN